MKRTELAVLPVLSFFLSALVLALTLSCSRQATEYSEESFYTALPAETTNECDAKAAEMFVKSKDALQLAERKAAITQALEIKGISFAMRTVLERERIQIETEEKAVAEKNAKPRTSFQAVSIPKQKPTARFGVNFNELMNTVNDAGITKDPFMQ